MTMVNSGSKGLNILGCRHAPLSPTAGSGGPDSLLELGPAKCCLTRTSSEEVIVCGVYLGMVGDN